MRYISTSFVPSEIFVQTILLNSPFKDQIAIYPDKLYKNLASLTPLQYIDYRPTGMEVLDETSFNAIISSNKMFFRKASSTKSFDLINLIDAYREKI